jgi:hypothetical protein
MEKLRLELEANFLGLRPEEEEQANETEAAPTA